MIFDIAWRRRRIVKKLMKLAKQANKLLAFTFLYSYEPASRNFHLVAPLDRDIRRAALADFFEKHPDDFEAVRRQLMGRGARRPRANH